MWTEEFHYDTLSFTWQVKPTICLKLFKFKRKEEMRHPFDLGKDELRSLDLNSVQDLTDVESESVSGGQAVSQTLTAVGPGESGESGGGMTTMAVGEEGGSNGYTMALTLSSGETGEGGGSGPFVMPTIPISFPGSSPSAL
jgi:hypothetical protein